MTGSSWVSSSRRAALWMNWSRPWPTFAEPAQQPWRGIGNLNLTRFDRTRAIELVQQWSEALENLRDRAAALARSSGWPSSESLRRSRARLCRCLVRFPILRRASNERVLAHAADGRFPAVHCELGNHALRAEQHDAFIARIADRAKLEANLHVGARAAAKAEELGVLNATPTELKSLGDQAQTEAGGARPSCS